MPSATTCASSFSSCSANSVDGRSVGRKLSALRHLYRYLLLDKMVEHDPTLNIDSPKQWKVLPKALARDEMESMLGRPQPPSNSKDAEALAVRDHAMLEVLYAAALRVSEVVSVKLEDLKLDLGCLLVRGKGDKERIVPLGKGAQDALVHYMKGARPILDKGKGSPLLFGPRRQKVDAARSVADGARGFGERGTQCQPAHAAAQLRHAHGRKRRRSAHRADHPRPRRYFHYAGVYAPGARPTEECVPEASSAGEGEVGECSFTTETQSESALISAP